MLQQKLLINSSFIWILLSQSALGQQLPARFTSLEMAKPVLSQLTDSLPSELRAKLSEENWQAWIRKADLDIRKRLQRGEEDSLSNLLRFGVTFTKEYRIDDEYFERLGQSSLVDSFVNRRADDLIRALACAAPKPGFAEARASLENWGYSLNTPAEQARLKKFLLNNLTRMHQEFLEARRANVLMFQQRGISLDTNLWPDYDLDVQFRRMAAQGMLKPGAVHKVAIVGPGLDFANKQEGVDYYPPQTVQPFAVLDSLIRLGLADASTVEVYTLDISSQVNSHVATIRRSAALRRPFVIQLPWFAEGRWTDEFRTQFNHYWEDLGSQIGDKAQPITVPRSVQGFRTRAVRVRPDVVQRIRPIDMNVVFQYLELPAEQRFDVIIGTNIFLYYGPFEQSLARRNIAAMLKSGGYLLSNDHLADVVKSGIDQKMLTTIVMTAEPVIRDSIFCYQLSASPML